MSLEWIYIIVIICLSSICINIWLIIEVRIRGRQIKYLIKDQTETILEIEEKEKIMQETLDILEMSIEDPDIAAIEKLREGLK